MSIPPPPLTQSEHTERAQSFDRLAIGGNNPPMLETAVADIREALVEFAPRAKQFADWAIAKVIRERQDVADAADTIKLARGVWDLIEIERDLRADPHKDAASAISRTAANFWQPTQNALAVLREKINAFTAAEDKRIEEQRLEQEAAEAKLRAAAAPAVAPVKAPPARTASVAAHPKRAPIVGDFGGRVSQVENKTFEVVDVRLIPLDILNSPKVVAAICAVAKDFAKHMAVIPGIRIDTGTTNQIRG